MADIELNLTLDGDPTELRGGETIEGTLDVHANKACECRALTVTAAWKATGAYESDEGEIPGVRLFAGKLESGQHTSYRFALPLPGAIWSYSGKSIQLGWSIHAKADLAGSGDAHARVPVEVTPAAGLTVETVAPSLGVLAGPTPGSGAVLPQIAQQTLLAENFGAKYQSGCLIIFGIFTILFTLPFIAALAFMISTAGPLFFNQFGPLAILPVVIFGLVGVVLPLGSGSAMLYAGARPYLARRFVGPVTVEIDPRVAGPGDTMKCSVSFQPTRALEVERVVIQLRAREVTWRRTSKSRTARRRQVWLEERDLEGGRLVRAGELVELNGAIKVPDDAPYSLGTPNHWLEWHAVIHISVRGWIDYASEHIVTVAPISAKEEIF